MSDVNEILKKVTASIEEATGKFNAKAEEALTEAKKNGKLSAETKETVDKMASELNALREAEKTLKAALGELEQHVAQMPLANAKQVIETVGQQVISAEALKTFAASVAASQRISIPVKAALLTANVPGNIVAPDRLPGIDTAPKQRLFIRDLIAPGTTASIPFTGCSKLALPITQRRSQKIRPNRTAILSLQKKSLQFEPLRIFSRHPNRSSMTFRNCSLRSMQKCASA